MGHERVVTSQVTSESLGQLPVWLRGFVASHRNEFKRCHSKAKEVLFRQEAHSIDRVWTVSEGKRSPGYGVVKFYRVK